MHNDQTNLHKGKVELAPSGKNLSPSMTLARALEITVLGIPNGVTACSERSFLEGLLVF